MKKINAAIVDDDTAFLKIVSGSLVGFFESRGLLLSLDCFTSAKAYLDAKRKDDLLFLDIEIPEMDGIALAKQVAQIVDPPTFIFLSSREDKVFESFSVHPFGFIRKNAFLKDMASVLTAYIDMAKKALPKYLEFVSKKQVLNVAISDILYLESYGDYQELHLKGEEKTTLLSSTMDRLEERLLPFGFLRIHKSFLVHFKAIKEFSKGKVLLYDGERLPISHRKENDVRESYIKLLGEKGTILL